MQFYQKRRENCVKTHVILKKASFYACLTLFAGMAFPMPLWASQSTAIVQQHVKQITGIVNDTSGAPVIGANVVEVGSTNGTITDVDGKFTLNVSVGAKLKVSYIGYNDQQITVGNSNSYTIILKEDTESLDEVVVVGYGTQKKVNLTGSVATISSDKLVNRTSANVTNMLAGQMPGVTIIQNTGQPGADAGVLRVRGLGTMGDASAMVVVDGVESTMSSVDPNDIENISILKDAAASAPAPAPSRPGRAGKAAGRAVFRRAAVRRRPCPWAGGKAGRAGRSLRRQMGLPSRRRCHQGAGRRERRAQEPRHDPGCEDLLRAAQRRGLLPEYHFL